jgi:hypothetical protein
MMPGGDLQQTDECGSQTTSDADRELSLLRPAAAQHADEDTLTRYQQRSGACILTFHSLWNVVKLLVLGVILLITGVDNSQQMEEFYGVPGNCAHCYDTALGVLVAGDEDPDHVFELAQCQRTFDSWKALSAASRGAPAAGFNCTTNSEWQHCLPRRCHLTLCLCLLSKSNKLNKGFVTKKKLIFDPSARPPLPQCFAREATTRSCRTSLP